MKLHLGRFPADRSGQVRARDAREHTHAAGDRDAAPHAAVNHVFSSDGYSAGYYSYLWSDTLTADAWEAFTEAGGPWDKARREALARQRVLVGNTIDPGMVTASSAGRDAASRR